MGIGSKAVEAMPAEFVGRSTAEEIGAVDTVDGDTVAFGALKEAVKAAKPTVRLDDHDRRRKTHPTHTPNPIRCTA